MAEPIPVAHTPREHLSPEQFQQLVQLLDLFQTSARLIKFLIIVIGALGVLALAFQRILLFNRAYWGEH